MNKFLLLSVRVLLLTQATSQLVNVSTFCQDPNCRLCDLNTTSCYSCGESSVAVNSTCVPANLSGLSNVTQNATTNTLQILNLTTNCSDPHCRFCAKDEVSCYSCGEGYAAVNLTCVSTNLSGLLNVTDNLTSNVLQKLNLTTKCTDPNCRICEKDGVSCYSCGEGFIALNNSCLAITPAAIISTTNSAFNNISNSIQGALNVALNCSDPNCQLCLIDQVSCLKCGEGYAAFNFTCISLPTLNLSNASNSSSNASNSSNATSSTCQDPKCLQCQLDNITCLQCGNGYYLQDASCVVINASNITQSVCQDPNCVQCLTDNITCTICINEYINQNSTCVQFNSTSMTLNGTCPDPNCLSCQSDNVTCVSCAQDFLLLNSSCVAFNSTSASTTCNDSNCQACQSDQVTCLICAQNYQPQNGSCVQVPSNLLPNSSCNDPNCVSCPNLSVCINCIPGYYQDFANPNGTCLACSSNCIQCISSSQCVQCAAGFNVSGNGTCQTSPSMPNTSPVNATSNCPILCQACSNNVTCTSCNIGYFIDTNSLCEPCGNNCQSCTDANTCLNCEPGFTLQPGNNCA